MSLKRLGLCGSVALSVFAGVANAEIVTVNFSGHTTGDYVGTTYSAIGLTFYYGYFGQCVGGCPPPNINGNFIYSYDYFVAQFSIPQTEVSFQSVSYSSTYAEADDYNFNYIDSTADNETSPVSGDVNTLSGSDIAYVVFYYDDGANGPAITNLTFNAIPEPASWATMLIGAGGVGTALRWRRRARGLPAMA
jgi:hypothetical protein